MHNTIGQINADGPIVFWIILCHFFKLPVLYIYEFEGAQNFPDHGGSRNFTPVHLF
jgi:hypothetical protein